MNLIKSKRRVADHGEVFTPRWLIDKMLDLVQGETERIVSRFLEPAVFHYKGREVDPQAVGRELNVKACVSTSTAITSTLNLNKTTIYDGLGRATQTQLTSDPGGVDYVDKTYDALGRKATVSNPHRTASSSTDGITTYGYDALDRVMKCLCRKICQWTRVTS